MQGDWIPIFTTNQLYQAQFVKETLGTNNIGTVILNQKDSSYHFGSITVMINLKDKEKATEILKLADCE